MPPELSGVLDQPLPEGPRRASDRGVGTLVRNVPMFEPTITCGSVAELFHNDPKVPAVIIVSGQAQYGLVDRTTYLPTYLDGFKRDLFNRKPITALMDNGPIVTPWDTPVEKVGLLLSAQNANAIRSSFIITRGGAALGIGLAIDLMRLVAHEAQERLQQLSRTQAHLVQAQTFASMGRLVAGVAHEINTPIGVSLTAATHLRTRIAELTRRFADNRLTRSEFSEFNTVANEAAAIVIDNVNRAARLISSFKNVAVDQATAERRTFGLKEIIEDTILSLSPTLRKTKIAVEIDCAPAVTMGSYPGPLSQVITNLTLNAIRHAFDPDEVGTIRIVAASDGETAQISFSDTGRGIAAENLPRIFEPFFTTRRSEGGTGLGLHIVHNLITQILGGTIECKPAAGPGTTFQLVLPLDHEVNTASRTRTPFGAPLQERQT